MNSDQNFYRLYAKFPFQNKYQALDLDEGTQVLNLIYATMIPEINLPKIKDIIKQNPDVKFKIVKIK